MIGLDTNVLIRHIMQDDPVQSPLASKLIDGLSPENSGGIATVTIVEVWWVLERSYQIGKPERIKLIEDMLDTEDFTFFDAELVRSALNRAKTGADFADAIIVESSTKAGCPTIATFYAKAAKHAGMFPVESLLPPQLQSIEEQWLSEIEEMRSGQPIRDPWAEL
jgi:predicted nucleic-acid-binding protein